jgi:hypothetical protein
MGRVNPALNATVISRRPILSQPETQHLGAMQLLLAPDSVDRVACLRWRMAGAAVDFALASVG